MEAHVQTLIAVVLPIKPMGSLHSSSSSIVQAAVEALELTN
jgi:hypothetical protein